MTYQVLARKWRPKDFASLVGQEHVVRALTHALDGARLHHAYLFTGTRGVGKTTLSRIFSKALNCEKGITSTPCGVCRACREIDEGRFIDYVEMDAASNRGVDEMAALLERAVYAPVDARFKVYMIDEVHMLSNHAFNAMLKTLEEPPPHVKFILATTDPQKIPVTVLSRCLQFNLKQMPAGHIVGHLEHILGAEGIAFEPQALRLLARAAEGSMRDALSLTDQAIAYSANQVSEEAVRGMLGALDQSYLIRLVEVLVEGDGPRVLDIADEMALRSLSFSTALQDLASLFHRIGWAQFAQSSVLDDWPEANDVRRFAQMLTPEQVQLYYQIATIGRNELALAPDEYAGFTMTLLRMLAFEPAAPGAGGPAGPAPRATAPVAGAASRRSSSPVSAQSSEGGVAQDASAGVSPVPAREVAQTVAPRAEQPMPAPRAEVPALPRRASNAGPEFTATPRVSDSTPVSSDRVGASDADAPASVGLTEHSQPHAMDNPAPVPPVRSGEQAVKPQDERPVPQSAEPLPAAGRNAGASAALEVLRSAGMRVSTDRNRVASAAKPAAAPARKEAVPRKPVVVPAPRARQAGGAAAAPAAAPQSPPPWDDAQAFDSAFDDGPSSFAEDAYFSTSNADNADDTARRGAVSMTGSQAAPVIDLSTLPPAVMLDAIGFAGDWPALAEGLSLKGVAHQLAFNSELIALDRKKLTLSVPVPQYAEAAQVAKLRDALEERLGKGLEVSVEVGPARRTAAALAAAARAQRQHEAEREIGADPFVQSLIREFGASIVPNSIKPVTPDAGAAAS
ncbi:DNA polymerase III subunit gamma/tau [Trinickia sp. LjRoot230]|uniref:DNA polymerase III subunit gamma/tau n=1 Tax=Trinickia sp. LjRoot230 TaxID=3342288 RepID=UPI003ECFB863